MGGESIIFFLIVAIVEENPIMVRWSVIPPQSHPSPRIRCHARPFPVASSCASPSSPRSRCATLCHTPPPPHLPSPPSSTIRCPASPSFMINFCNQPLSRLLQPPSPAGPVFAYALPRAAILCSLSGPLGTLLMFFIG